MSGVIPTKRAGSLGGDRNKYICSDCGLVIKKRVWNGGYAVDILICPVCTSKEKKPTEKLDIEELERRKTEIKKRCLK